MSMTTIIVLVATLIIALILSLRKPVAALIFAIPVVYVSYFLFINEYTERMGYPVDGTSISERSAYMIFGIQTREKLVLMIKEDNADEPRLVYLDRTDELDQKFEQLQKPESNHRIIVGKDLIPESIFDNIEKLLTGQPSGTEGNPGAGSDGENTNKDGLELRPDDNLFKKEG